MKITARLTQIKQTETLLIGTQEVEQIHFCLTLDDATETQCYAVSDDGTAYHTLQTDASFRVGVKVICITSEAEPTGIRKATGLRLFDTADASGKQETEIARLKDKAMQNMNLTRGELHALLASFDSDSPQHYALAIQLKRQHRDKTVAIAEKVCRCTRCKSVFELDSPRYTFAWGKTRCPKCNDNVNFDTVDPLPREPAEKEELDWQEMQRRLKSRFGGGNSG